MHGEGGGGGGVLMSYMAVVVWRAFTKSVERTGDGLSSSPGFPCGYV